MRPEVRDWLEEIACRAGLSALPKPGVLAAAAVCLVLLGIGAWRWLAGPVGVKPLSAATQAPAAGARSSGTAAGDSAETTESAQVTVHVVGAVRTPGVYALRKGSRAADAVEAAGGLLGNAAPSALNLARVVQDGEQVVVPTADEAATGAAAAGGAGRSTFSYKSASARCAPTDCRSSESSRLPPKVSNQRPSGWRVYNSALTRSEDTSRYSPTDSTER